MGGLTVDRDWEGWLIVQKIRWNQGNSIADFSGFGNGRDGFEPVREAYRRKLADDGELGRRLCRVEDGELIRRSLAVGQRAESRPGTLRRNARGGLFDDKGVFRARPRRVVAN